MNLKLHVLALRSVLEYNRDNNAPCPITLITTNCCDSATQTHARLYKNTRCTPSLNQHSPNVTQCPQVRPGQVKLNDI